MAISDFLAFATGAGANVENQATYASDPSTSAGFSAGIAQSGKLNKVWRQSSFISAAVAQLVMQELGVDVLDDGDLAGFTGKLHDALVALQPRQVLYANQTFYVNSTIGSDTFSGKSPTAPWLSLQHAADQLCFNLDINNKNVIIQIADGVYPGFRMSSTVLGCGDPSQIIFQGNMTTPTNVVITPNPVTGSCVIARNNTICTLQGVRFSALTPPFSGAECDAVAVLNLGRIRMHACDFAACAGNHLSTGQGGQLRINGAYSVSGGATNHIIAYANGRFLGATANPDFGIAPIINVTLTGTPAFSNSFVRCHQSSVVILWDGTSPLMTWTGAATGRRFWVSTNSLIHTSGQSTTWLPGDTTGLTDATTYGVYS